MHIQDKSLTFALRNDKMKNIAVILAAGSGKRMGAERPKQFLQLLGRPILAYSIEAFQKNTHIDDIIIVGNPEFMDETRQTAEAVGATKLRAVIPGGVERTDSTLAAIDYVNSFSPQQLRGETLNMLFHDAARPLISDELITRICTQLIAEEAVSVCKRCPRGRCRLHVSVRRNSAISSKVMNCTFTITRPRS